MYDYLANTDFVITWFYNLDLWVHIFKAKSTQYNSDDTASSSNKSKLDYKSGS